jgi:hypothetical protein
MQIHTPRFFVVLGLTDADGAETIGAGTIPGTSPNLVDGTVTQGSYTLLKCGDDVNPLGTRVTEVLFEEAQAISDSSLFNSGVSTPAFVKREKEFCDFMREVFMADQAGLGTVAGDALLTALEPTNQALSAGSVSLAYTRFNASSVDQAVKDTYNPYFVDYFIKHPRDLSP